jgi:hypothetical protein
LERLQDFGKHFPTEKRLKNKGHNGPLDAKTCAKRVLKGSNQLYITFHSILFYSSEEKHADLIKNCVIRKLMFKEALKIYDEERWV